MLKNATYDLMETASVISKGLQDAADCQHCQQLWQTMKQHDEQQLNQVTQHLKQHLDKEMKSTAAA